MIDRWLKHLGGRSKPSVFGLGLLLALFLGWVDVLSGREISFSLFYLLPIGLITWVLGLGPGLLISFASALIWRVADGISGATYSHPVIVYWNTTSRFGFFILIAYLISALKERLEREKHLASTDPLTGSANRRFFYQIAEQEMARAQRYSHPLTVAYIDVDDFKTVNDTLGHQEGDRILIMVSQTIHDHLRSLDTVARLGGDEFAILLPETGREAGQEVIHKLQKLLDCSIEVEKVDVTFSIGAMTFESPPKSVDEMIAAADGLMYAVKRGGKNQIRHEVYRI